MTGSPPGAPADLPRVPFRELRSLWPQVAGTLCNLACTDCLNASGPRHPWLAPMEADQARQALAEAEALGAREVYFTDARRWLGALPPARRVTLGEHRLYLCHGTPRVWSTLLTAASDLVVEFVPIGDDSEALAREMDREGLPPESSETIRTGWWTCCLEALPAKERSRGKF